MLIRRFLGLVCSLLIATSLTSNAQTGTKIVPPSAAVVAHKKERKKLSTAHYKARAKGLVNRVLRKNFFKKIVPDFVGYATWYGIGDGFQGARTSSGVRFNTYAPMCAMHRGAVPLHTKVIVENPYNGKRAKCTILDHLGNPGAVIDLSWEVAKAIGRTGNGLVNIYVTK